MAKISYKFDHLESEECRKIVNLCIICMNKVWLTWDALRSCFEILPIVHTPKKLTPSFAKLCTAQPQLDLHFFYLQFMPIF